MWPFAVPFSTLWLWPAYSVFILSSSPGWVAFALSSHPSSLRHNCHIVAWMWLITFSVTVTPPPLGLCWYLYHWAVGLLQLCCPALQLPLPYSGLLCLHISTILKIQSGQGHPKAFAISASHFTVVSMGYGVSIFVSVCPSQKGSLHLSNVLFILSSVFTPLLNPFIFSLWNETVKEALKDTLVKCQNSVKGLRPKRQDIWVWSQIWVFLDLQKMSSSVDNCKMGYEFVIFFCIICSHKSIAKLNFCTIYFSSWLNKNWNIIW